MRAGDSSGIMDYFWGLDGKSILIPSGGKQYVFDIESRTAVPLDIPEEVGSMTDAKLSPRGRYVSFVANQNLFVFEMATLQLIQITSDGGGPVSNGAAEFVAQEEMDRYTGYWWAPDETSIAYERFDESQALL